MFGDGAITQYATTGFASEFAGVVNAPSVEWMDNFDARRRKHRDALRHNKPTTIVAIAQDVFDSTASTEEPFDSSVLLAMDEDFWMIESLLASS